MNFMLKSSFYNVIFLLVFISANCTFAANKTIYVPDDVKTVNGAMKQAKSGDTIILRPGDYREIVIFKDGVTLKGEDRDKCRLLPVKDMPAVILARNCESGTITNLTVDGENQDAGPMFFVNFKDDLSISETKIGISKISPSSEKVPKGSTLVSINGMPWYHASYVIPLEGKSIDVEVKIRLKNGKTKIIKTHTVPLREDEGWPSGIVLIDSNMTVKNCTVRNIKASAITAIAMKPSSITVTNCICLNNGYGISIGGGETKAHLSKNNCSNNRSDAINIFADAHTQIINNICSYNKSHGITIEECSTANINNNKCSNNSVAGIAVYENSQAHINKNICVSNKVGIGVGTKSSAIITENKCNKSEFGIYIKENSQAQISANTCNNNTYWGIGIRETSKGRVIKNKCTANEQAGIYIGGKSSAYLLENTCYMNGNSGIYFCGNSTGKLVKNICNKNYDCGILVIEKSFITAENNECNENDLGIAFKDGASGKVSNNSFKHNREKAISKNKAGQVHLDNNKISQY